MKIKGSENIREIFSLFHDGGIVNCRMENNTLMMDVEIQVRRARKKRAKAEAATETARKPEPRDSTIDSSIRANTAEAT